MTRELIAAIDLGSNSFRLQIGRIVNDQIYPLDGIKEAVRLAAGLSPDRMLDAASQFRGISALRCFNERIRDYPLEAVRAVATNTLRVAKNAPHFLVQAEAALGFPIEVIAGREEARLIYVGVAHTLPNPHKQQLVVDIGGGSTEFVIGKSFKPIALESLYMGCVSYSLRFFPDGRIDKRVCARPTHRAKEIRPSPMPIAKWAGTRRWAPAVRPRRWWISSSSTAFPTAALPAVVSSACATSCSRPAAWTTCTSKACAPIACRC
jgi:exopolyphosphatase/pppGpp-phosphohydrolase